MLATRPGAACDQGRLVVRRGSRSGAAHGLVRLVVWCSSWSGAAHSHMRLGSGYELLRADRNARHAVSTCEMRSAHAKCGRHMQNAVGHGSRSGVAHVQAWLTMARLTVGHGSRSGGSHYLRPASLQRPASLHRPGSSHRLRLAVSSAACRRGGACAARSHDLGLIDVHATLMKEDGRLGRQRPAVRAPTAWRRSRAYG